MEQNKRRERARQEAGELRSYSNFGKVGCSCIVFSVSGADGELTIPAFTPSQVFGVLKIIDFAGNDYSLTYRLASYLLEKVIDFNLDMPGVLPSNKLYSSWLTEFRLREGLITGQFGGVA